MKHLKLFFLYRLRLKGKKVCLKAQAGYLLPTMSLFLLISFFLAIGQGFSADRISSPSPDTASDLAVPTFRVASWDPDSGLGNHRALVMVRKKADAVFVRIPWRRPDPTPEKKRVLLFVGKDHKEVKNVFPIKINNEYGDFLFQATEAPAEYYFYYLPYKLEGKNYPKVTYLPAEYQAEPGWLLRNGLNQPGSLNIGAFPRAEIVALESVDEFSSFYPMEVIATAAEVQKIISAHKDKPFLIFPEDRRFPVRLTDFLPQRWVERGPKTFFAGQVDRGEYFVFQLPLFAHQQKLEKVNIKFSNFTDSSSNNRIKADQATCFNLEGIGWDGTYFRKEVSVEKGKIGPLWCGINVPQDIPPGEYTGEAEISAENVPPQKVKIILKVTPRIIDEAGDAELWRLSRLRWLNSLLAVDDEVIRPFTPLEVKGRTISCLGRALTLSKTGLPEKIESYFTEEMTSIGSRAFPLLDKPFQLVIRNFSGLNQEVRNKSFKFTRLSPGAVSWIAENEVPTLKLQMKVEGRMEFDGFVAIQVAITAAQEAEVDDIRLSFALREKAAPYMMGLGFKGGKRPASFSWTWNKEKNQDALWLGSVNAGLQIQLKAENYSRPLNTNFYQLKPLNLPPSWWNEGKGWISVKEEPKENKKERRVVFIAASGPRKINQDETLHFDFNLLLTPFKPINPGKHFSERYYHAYKPVAEIAATGANVINVHHANEINPFINYPFLRPEKMKAYIDEAHQHGLKVKIYYTIRELSNRAAELFVLKSLGNEIFTDGPGGGYSWLQEHLRSNYIPGWFVPELKDAAVINSGMSRWHNYYVEGLAWLCRHVGIDGLYIDDVAFDRITMKRVRKVLERYRPGSLIDLHSANQYNPRDGYASSANLYLEHFPYLDRLWFGEYFDYDSPPDYWLVEMSGIPFGLMGEMLEKGGNPWRGMIFGMTARLPWSGDPRPLWKIWDEFGLIEAQMFGFWASSCPVKTGCADVLATAYVRKEATLVALASWSKKKENCQLLIDWKKLGLDPKNAVIEAPAVENFQPGLHFQPNEAIPVEPGKGWILIIKPRSKA
ncbi:MAG: hypothetical protein H5U07_07080 [Candidatus Aminicenantes bacterium]|nr:hypothetical protein [Candidatus Aminicenantes bacterium]